jgi:hypothetical protein
MSVSKRIAPLTLANQRRAGSQGYARPDAIRRGTTAAAGARPHNSGFLTTAEGMTAKQFFRRPAVPRDLRRPPQPAEAGPHRVTGSATPARPQPP